MKTYSVCIPWHASVTVTVKAKSKKEAMEKALEEAYPSLCHQCSGPICMDGGPDEKHYNLDCVEEVVE